MDIWACGLITFEMLNGTHPIKNACKMKQDEYIALFKNRPTDDIFDIPSTFKPT